MKSGSCPSENTLQIQLVILHVFSTFFRQPTFLMCRDAREPFMKLAQLKALAWMK